VTAVLAADTRRPRPAPWRPPCTRDPDAWFRADGDHRHSAWWYAPAIACHGCPIRRACIERWLAGPAPDCVGMVVGGWVWTWRGIRPHPDDRDLYERHYLQRTTEESR
jgi:hypothetical protein